MTNSWDERKKALEDEYFLRQEKAKIEKLRRSAQTEAEQDICHNRCPKCGQHLEAITFREVPLDKCPDCGGVWLGPKDLETLAEKDHRTWFEKWFGEKEQAL